jgi:hypothetical protein
MYYYPTQPPYFLLLLGFFIALTSGLALSGTLKLIVRQWSTSSKKTQPYSTGKKLLLPFIGITVGACAFLSSGLAIFGFPVLLALGVGLPLSLLTCILLWIQLGSMLEFAQRQGIQSLDLDSPT